MRLGATSTLAGLLLAVAACGARAPGPAWPKAAEVEPADDGGESLAPRHPVLVASAEDDEDEVAATPAAAEPAAAAEATPATATAEPAAEPADTVITAPEEVINLDDIVIEIEEE